MVHMRCQHLHSEVTQTQRLWRALLLTRQSSQTRQVSSLARSNKVSSFQTEIDSLEQQLLSKAISKRRIPVHVSKSVNKRLSSPSIFTVHKLLQNNEVEEAWKLLDKSIVDLTHIPPTTAHLLLQSLRTQVEDNLPRLALNFGKLQHLYFNRLEKLAGLVRQSHIPLWNEAEFSIVIEIYGRLDQIKRAESIFRNISQYCNSQPTTDHYNTLISIYIGRFKFMDEITQKRCLSRLKTIELEMTRKGLMDTNAYNMLIAAQVKSHNLQAAEKIFEKMEYPNRTTYHILLNGHLKNCKTARDKEITNNWMEKMITSGHSLNRKTFINIIDGLGDQIARFVRMKEKKDVESTTQSVLNLNKLMVELRLTPDTEVVNSLLKCYTAANHTEEIEKILSTLDLPEKSSGGGCGNCGCGKKAPVIETPKKKSIPKVKPDTYTFNMLIKYYLDNENPNQAFQMYDTMVTLELDPDTVTYGDFIRYYADKNNVKESLKYYHVMKSKGIPVNNYIYNILLDCSLKHPQYAHLITPHLRTMLVDGSATLDSVSQNILLARGHQDQDLDASFDRFANSIDFNTNGLSTRTYNTILQSAGKFYKSSAPSIDDVIRSLDISKLEPDIYTFALSIRNATYRGDMDKAESFFKSMIDSGVQPNTYVLSHLIYGYSIIGKIDKAHDVLKGMSAAPYNVVPNAISYAPLIKGYSENAEFEKAYALFREMLDKNIPADLVIYTILARVFLESGNEKQAIELLEGINKGGISTDAASLTLLAEAYSMEKNVEKIDTIYAMLKDKNWLDEKAITSLLKSYSNANNPEGGWKLWNDLKKENQPLTIYHYNALFTCLSPEKKAWYPVNKIVYEELKQDAHVNPDSYTFDLLIWGAYNASDSDNIRRLWNDIHRNNKPLLVRTYYAVITAFVNNRQLDIAKQAYKDYRKLRNLPNCSTVWIEMIESIAKNQDFNSL